MVWVALLVTVAIGVWALQTARRERVRGIPRGFPAPVADADVPMLGVNVALEQYSDQELAEALQRITDGGIVWVRQSFTSNRLGAANSGELDWSAADRIVGALRRHPELRLLAVLEEDPPVPPDDPEAFASFAAAFADRYGDSIDHYQIWDEPNLAVQWGGGPTNPSAYADLLARSARAIRLADPGARILLAGLAPTTETGPENWSEVRYLERLYQAGAAPYFDIVASKPYGFDTGPEDRRVDESLLNVSRVLLLRDVMEEWGDADKAVWATQWGWNALPQGWQGEPSIWGQTDEATQAARSVAMLDRARSEWPWMGAMIIENLQPRRSPTETVDHALMDPRWGFSLLAPDGTSRPVYKALAGWIRSASDDGAPVGGYAAVNPWASYQGTWRVGPLGADTGASWRDANGWMAGAASPANKARFRFDGSRVAVTVRRGPYRAFLYVTVDGEPANAIPCDELGRAYVVLYDAESSLATVPLATGLDPGSHLVEMVAEGGEGQWSLVDWRVGGAVPCGGMTWALIGLAGLGLVLVALLVRDVRRTSWRPLAVAFLDLRSEVQVGLALALTGLLWVTAGLSWGRIGPVAMLLAVCLALSLLTLPLLATLFALRLDLGLALVAAAAPFYLVPDTLFYGGLSIAEVLVALCLVAYLGSRFWPSRLPTAPSKVGVRGGEPVARPRSAVTAIDAGVALLVLAALVATTAADDGRAALFELRSVFVFPALYYGLLRAVPLGESGRRRLLDCFLLGGVGVALVGLAQVVLGRHLVAAEGGLLRLQSVYHSPNSVGLYLGRVWPFLVAGAGWARGTRRRVVHGAALALVTVALVLSFSRGALLLAVPAAILVMGWWAGGRYRWLAVALVAVEALAVVPLLRLPRFAALLDLEQGTTFFRLQLWRSSLSMIRDQPLLGVGPGNFQRAYRTRYVLPTAWEEFNLGHAHNILLDHWTILGALGVVAGLTLQIGFWRVLWQGRSRRARAVGLAGSMAALLAHGLVDNAVFLPDLALGFFLVLALAHGATEATGDRTSADREERTEHR